MVEVTEYGALCLIPVACVFIVAMITKRTVEALVTGALVGWFIISKQNFLWDTLNSAVETAADYDTMWIILVCGLFGSIIALIQKSGGAVAFGNFLARFVRGEKSALFISWLMGLLIFVDDYLNCLVVGSTMRQITDDLKIPRASLAYVVDATASPICILIPISTWCVYLVGLIESNGFAPEGQGMETYIQTIPFMFYNIICEVIVVLFAIKVIPIFGPMKKAYRIAKETGDVFSGLPSNKSKPLMPDESIKPHIIDFVLPMVALVAITILTGIDLLKGVGATLLICLIIYLPRKRIKPAEALDSLFDGFNTMFIPICIIVAGFMMVEVNSTLGLTPFVINLAEPYLNGVLFAAIVFTIQAGIGFFTGSNWGTWAIMMPIVVPLGELAGVPLALTLGALFSGGGFGGHACGWSDSTVLASAGAGIDNFEHMKTQLPYALLGGVVSIVLYIIVSIIMI